MTLAALLVAALLSQDRAPGPSIERSDAAFTLRFGDKLVIDYGLRPAGVRDVELGGARVQAGELRLDGAVPVSAEVLDARVEADVVVLELALRSTSATLRATDTFRAVRLAGGLGLERRLRAQRRGVQSDLLELVTAPDAPEPGVEPPRPDRTVERYGVSTVSEPGTTTTLTRAMRPGGVTVWSYRAGLNFMSQALNPGLDVEWTEVLLLLPSAPDEASDERVGATLVQALVNDPYDRRALVRDWSAAQHRLLYETPVERVLDPGLGSLRGAGVVGDPWPALAKCHERSLATLLAPGSRLVLFSGDHGAYHATRALLVGAAATGEAPAVMQGFDVARAEGYDLNRARVTLRLADAVTVELWGDQLVARHVETPSGRFETDWEEVREVELAGTAGKHAVAQASRLRLWRDEAEVGLEWTWAGAPRSGSDRLRAVEVAGTWGLVRRICAARDDLEGLDSIIIAPDPTSQPGRPNDSRSSYEHVLDERGVYWNVCRFAVNYVVLKKSLADGSTQWWICYGQLPLDQSADSVNAIDLVEASFLAGRDSRLNLGELLAALVDNDTDRRALLRTHAPAVFEREYGRGH